MKRVLALGVAAVVACSAALGVDFSSRAYDCAPNQTVFVSAFQRYVRLKDSDGPDNRYNPTAGAVGYVYSQGMWEVGAAFSYEHGTRKYKTGNSGFKVQSDIPGISLFGTVRNPTGWYVEGTAFVGYGTFKSKDLWDGGNRLGSGDRNHKTMFAASLEAGKVFDFGYDMALTPHLGVDYAYAPRENYARNGLGANFASQSYWEIPLGVTLSRTFHYGAWSFTPRADATLVTSLGKIDNMNANPGFAYRTGRGWKVAAIGGDHVGARLSAGLDAKVGDRTTLGIDYTYEGRKHYNDHRISALLGWSF